MKGAICLFLACAASAQEPAHQSAFEVASVKPADAASAGPGSNIMRGGPGTADPGRITFLAVTLKRLLMAAYGVGTEQVSGPGWLDVERFAITAKVPAGAGKVDVRLMLQNLLAERFHLKFHHEARDFPAYELVVAKRGAKLRPAVVGSSRAGLDGAPPLPGHYATAMLGTVCRLSCRQFPVADLPRVLGIPLGKMAGNMLATATVIDKTGLDGEYDFTLEFEGFMGPGGAFPTPSPDATGVVPAASE